MLSFAIHTFLPLLVRLELYSHGLVLGKRIGRIEVFAGARAFDDFLDNRLNFVPVLCWEGSHLDD